MDHDVFGFLVNTISISMNDNVFNLQHDTHLLWIITNTLVIKTNVLINWLIGEHDFNMNDIMASMSVQ